jgi:hypothetical protein
MKRSLRPLSNFHFPRTVVRQFLLSMILLVVTPLIARFTLQSFDFRYVVVIVLGGLVMTAEISQLMFSIARQQRESGTQCWFLTTLLERFLPEVATVTIDHINEHYEFLQSTEGRKDAKRFYIQQILHTIWTIVLTRVGIFL